MRLAERAAEFGRLTARADAARAGRGGMQIVSGESGGGKTTLVETFIEEWVGDERVLWGSCDPLPTPRPLGPVHDLADRLAPATRAVLRDSAQHFDVFAAVFQDLAATPSVLIIDDLHWADQGTVDLLRYVLRRVARTSSLVIGIVRDEIALTHPVRALLGDVARAADADSIEVRPLSAQAVQTLVGDRSVDAAWLHSLTGGNAFFVCEMLEHEGEELPTTIRDAVLARTSSLDADAWDLLHLLTCSPEVLSDAMLMRLGVGLPALRGLDDAGLIRRTSRGLAFRHDLYRLAIDDAMPPGAGAGLHRRLIDAYEGAPEIDPAVLTYHALEAGDHQRIRRAARDAGHAAARSGAHTQAADFFSVALERGGPLAADDEAGLLESLAAEFYLIDRLDDAIAACARALRIRREQGALAEVSADHHALAVYQWYNANRTLAEDHTARAVAVLADDAGPAAEPKLVQLGHGFAMQAFMAVHASDLDRADAVIVRAVEIAELVDDPDLRARVHLIENYCAVLRNDPAGRESILSILAGGPKYVDEIYSSGYSNLTYFDVEQRRLEPAADLLDVSLPLTVEYDLPICRVWQLGTRARLEFLRGEWDSALTDADTVLDGPTAPLARTWPLLIGSLVRLRRDGLARNGIDESWQLAQRYGEPMRMLPAAAAIAESMWITGSDDSRIDECRALLESSSGAGLEWSRGELAGWLHRLGVTVDATGVAEPYQLLLGGECAAAAQVFQRLSTPYDAALALIDTMDPAPCREGLDLLDRLGADAVADRVRRELRSRGMTGIPARRRAATLANSVGLTARQVEVLRLLELGLTNAELAERLFLSVKTVDHHVSAILTKLDVGKRRDAVRRARDLGVLA